MKLAFLPFGIQKLLFPFAACAYAWRLHKKNHYHMTWSLMANYAGFAALFFKWTHGDVPFLLNLQEGDPIAYIKKRVGIFYPVFKRIFTRADIVTAISTYLAEWAREMGAAHVIVMPNGADTEKFKNQNSKVKREEKRIEFGLAEDDTVLITTSRLVEKNAVADIIESLTYLPENVKLLIAGTGALESVLKFKVQSLKLSDRVKFLGFLPHEKLPEYLWASDIFIRPSLSEGQGASFIEAMAAGLPVIATPVGGIPDFLKDGETGLFCEVRNPRSIAQKIEKLMKDRESRDYIVKNALAMIEEKYGWDLIARRMKEEVFDNFLAPRS